LKKKGLRSAMIAVYGLTRTWDWEGERGGRIGRIARMSDPLQRRSTRWWTHYTHGDGEGRRGLAEKGGGAPYGRGKKGGWRVEQMSRASVVHQRLAQ